MKPTKFVHNGMQGVVGGVVTTRQILLPDDIVIVAIDIACTLNPTDMTTIANYVGIAQVHLNGLHYAETLPSTDLDNSVLVTVKVQFNQATADASMNPMGANKFISGIRVPVPARSPINLVCVETSGGATLFGDFTIYYE